MGSSLPAVSHPVTSSAVDWLSVSFKNHSDDLLDEQFAFTRWLAAQVDETEEWSDPRPSRHFTASASHPAGVKFQYSPTTRKSISEIVRNQGVSAIDLTGKFFASTTAKFHQDVFDLVRTLPGFYRCNRLDAQITILEPEVDAQAVAELVERREIWPVGFGRGQAYCDRLQSGEIAGAVTQYFGSKDSRIRARVYDKAAEQGWDVPAARAEVQMRREPADQWFRRLAKACENERDVKPLLVTAEARTVRDIVGAELDLRDTSAWVDRDLPQRWAQYAPVPGWWRDWVAQEVDPLKVQYRRPQDLAATTQAALDQYGRKVALELVRRCVSENADMDEVLRGLFFRGVARWRQDDLAILLAFLPEEDHERARELYRAFTNAAAQITELCVV